MIFLIRFLFAISIAFAGSIAFATPGEIPIGGTLRDATMQGLSGPSKKLSAYRGKPLIINVWASWCGPCRAEMASLERLWKGSAGKSFNVIGISTDDYIDLARAYQQKSGTSFSHYIDYQVQLENMLGADRIPLTLLVDARGKVLAKYYGAQDWDSVEARALIEQAFSRGK